MYPQNRPGHVTGDTLHVVCDDMNFKSYSGLCYGICYNISLNFTVACRVLIIYSILNPEEFSVYVQVQSPTGYWHVYQPTHNQMSQPVTRCGTHDAV